MSSLFKKPLLQQVSKKVTSYKAMWSYITVARPHVHQAYSTKGHSDVSNRVVSL